MYNRTRALRALILIALAGAASCGGGDPTGNQGPRSILRVLGDGQTGPVNAALPAQLVVLVSDGAGRPTPGVPVTWATDDGGSFPTATTVTESDGSARNTWTLGPDTGLQTARASISTGNVAFTANATAQ